MNWISKTAITLQRLDTHEPGPTGGFQTLPDLLCFHMITPVNVHSLAALQRLDANKQAWAQVSCKERAHMLRECARRVPELARSLAEVATTAKGAGPTGLGDEW